MSGIGRSVAFLTLAGFVLLPVQPRLPVLPRDRRPPTARARRAVPNTSQPIAAEPVGTIAQPDRTNRDVMRHDGMIPR